MQISIRQAWWVLIAVLIIAYPISAKAAEMQSRYTVRHFYQVGMALLRSALVVA